MEDIDDTCWQVTKENVGKKISLLLLFMMALELVVLIVLISFEYNHHSPNYYYYIISLVWLIVATMYFSWQSVTPMQLVRESPFELVSFLVISSVLCFHGIYICVARVSNPVGQVLGSFILIVAQLLYFASFWIAYKRNEWRVMSELNTENRGVVGNLYTENFRIFAIFTSILKLDFFLYSVTISSFLFYVCLYYWDFMIKGIMLSIIFYFIVIATTVLGFRAAFKEGKFRTHLFLFLTPICGGIKIYCMVFVIVSPDDDFQVFLLTQAIIVGIINALVTLALWYFAFWLSRHSGKGLRQLLEHSNESLIKRPFI